jgi:hypothetical protein
MKKRLTIISFIFLSLFVVQADNGNSNKYNPDTDSHRDPFEQFLHDHQDTLQSYQGQLITYKSYRSQRANEVLDKDWVLGQQKSQNEWLQKQLAYFKDPKLKDMFIQITEEKIKKLNEIEGEIDKIMDDRKEYLENIAKHIKELKIGEDTKDSVHQKFPPLNPNWCIGNSWTYFINTKDARVIVGFNFDNLSKLTGVGVTKIADGGSEVMYQKQNP